MSWIYYTESTPIASTGTGSASTAMATLTSAPGRVAYITGFVLSGLGATSATTVALTVTGLLGGNQTYQIAVPAGVTTAITPLQVNYQIPLPASAVNTNIVVSVPSFGSGNTNSSVAAYGYLK